MSEQEQVRRRLERAERLLGCFQKALAHELPNQLVAIQGLLRVLELEERDRLGPEGLDYVSRAIAAAQRTHELVRALAGLGRAGREDQPAEAVALAEAASEAVAEVKLLHPGCQIEYDFPQTAPVLTVARPTLHQVLVRLLCNAARAGSEDRPVRALLGARTTDAGVEFWVADNGRGMSPEQQQQLFEPFANPADAGRGLGLFMVRQVVESWGGVLHVASEPGRGSTFTIQVGSG
jgi:signal transduction histidine kinase